MNPAFAIGVVLTAVGLVGYAIGIVVTYPGRAFSLTAIMIGITMTLVSRAREEVV